MRRVLFLFYVCLSVAISVLQAQTVFTSISTLPGAGSARFYYHGSEPVGQEFIAPLAGLDFVDLRWFGSLRRPYAVTVREGSINGPIVAVSAPAEAQVDEEATRFVFFNTVPLVPSALYVLEFSPLDVTVLEELQLGRWTRNQYVGGRLIRHGVPVEDEDLQFALGLFMPEIAPMTNEVRILNYREQQGTLFLASAADFENPFLTDLAGATLTVSTIDYHPYLNLSLGLSGAPDGLVSVGNTIVGTVTNNYFPQTLVITFNANATDVAVETVIRRLYYFSELDLPFPAMVPLKVRFQSSQGEAEFGLTLSFEPVDDPPEVLIQVTGQASFLRDELSVVIVRSVREARVELNGTFSSDAESEPLQYQWFADNAALEHATEPVMTNRFPPGVHTIGLAVYDGHTQSFDTTTFKVITMQEGLRQMVRLVREPGVPQKGRLIALLRRSALAFAQRRYGAGARLLFNFEEKLRETLVLTDPQTAAELFLAAEAIRMATIR